jgi:hypothetical protein
MKDLMHTLFTLVRRVWQPALMMSVTLVAFTRCIEWKQPTDADVPGVARYVAGVQTVAGDANAVLRSGAVPSAGSGPVLSAPIPALILLGGTIQVTASAATPFSTILVAVPGVTDYWELTLPAATTQVQVLIVFSQEIPKTTFELNLAGGLGSTRGALQTSPVSVIAVGTGDIQVNITWDSPADVDLHVVDPSNSEVYWAAKTSATGGQLDLDSNAGCATDGPRAENVFWASGLIAPHGEYLVRVDHWSSCGAQLTNYVVTVNSKGKPPRVFQGVFTGTGDAGGKGSGKNIVALTY